ncbi:MAG: TauD/TfdA dioxygenase family protein [Lautropia sp.]
MSAIRIVKPPRPLGARIEGLDVNRDIDEIELLLIEQVLYHNSFVAIGGQQLDAAGMARFCARLGKLHRNTTSPFCTPELPEVMVLSNMRDDEGRQLGAMDAGQDWHTDMSYNAVPGRLTALHAHRVPVRDGIALGDTQFVDLYAVYESLPTDLRARLDDAVAVHDFHKYYDAALKAGSSRPPLTAEQRAMRPPVRHPMVGRHPVTGRKFLYANPGYATEIVGMDPQESQAVLQQLFALQTEPRFTYCHSWRCGDILIWDNWSTIHKATGDYRPDEHRYMLRAQITSEGLRFGSDQQTTDSHGASV